jgi:hypothetical protein
MQDFHCDNIKGLTMQYLKQDANGERKSVSYETYMVDSYDKAFVQVIASGSILVYRVAKAEPLAYTRPLKYGGKRFMSNGVPLHG